MKSMACFGRSLKVFAGRLDDERGVTSAEYAILAVGVVLVVGGAIMAFDLNNPLTYASAALTSGQSSLTAAGAR
jgi:Flp pilus assembly pilin Flp